MELLGGGGGGNQNYVHFSQILKKWGFTNVISYTAFFVPSNSRLRRSPQFSLRLVAIINSIRFSKGSMHNVQYYL